MSIDSREPLPYALEIQALEVVYPRFHLGPLSFDVASGSWTCIVGPSGCGKTSLLRTINLLTLPSKGCIRIFGHTSFSSSDHGTTSGLTINEVRRKVGMVFQQPSLWPHRTILANVMEGPMTILRRDKTIVRREALELLERMRIIDKAETYPHQVSGGQAQRAAIARALAMKPNILLCDEITSGLDPIAAIEVLNLMLEQQRIHGLTILMSTHNLGFIRSVASQIIVVDDGKLVEAETPNIFFAGPNSDAGKKLLSASNITCQV